MDVDEVEVDGRESGPNTFAGSRDAFGLAPLEGSRWSRALKAVEVAALCPSCSRSPTALEGVDGVGPACAAHELPKSIVGDKSTDVFASKHADPEGLPAAPLPSVPLADKSSDADDGLFPHVVPRLASVGTPAEASAVEQVEACVGSSTEPIPAADPANEPVAVA